MMTGSPVAAFGSMATISSVGTPHSISAMTTPLQQRPPSFSLRSNRWVKPASEMSMSMSSVLNFPRGGAVSVVEAAKSWNASPSNLFNSSLFTLALLTATFKVLQRAAAGDSDSSAVTKPKSVKDLQIRFLSVFWLLRCADWLQGPYFYEVYASKVFNGVPASLALVSKLFLTGFASTALFGPLVGRALDS